MHGNVWEWCEDKYSADDGRYRDRVARGGSWLDDAKRCTASYRFPNHPDRSYIYPGNLGKPNVGFRLAAFHD